jgi:nucleotide-binding universal stress UspA family protein
VFGRMLIPLDGSKTAEDVLPYARRLAAGARVAVELLGVVEMADIAEDIASNQAALQERWLETL